VLPPVQEEVFAELLLVRKVASSYRACLAEVVRRKAYAELYMRKAGQLAERMARDRDAEVARREEFMRQQGLLPREILEGMGLSGNPSQCEVNVPAFDSSLLDIDVSDLQGLAQIGGGQEERPKSRLGSGSRQLVASMSGSGAMVTSTMVGSQKAGAFEGGDISIMTGMEHREATMVEGGAEQFDMELENAWLRSEYAAAVAMLCTLEEEEEEEGGEVEAEGPPPRRREAVKSVAEALRRKDEHAQFLQESLGKQKQQLEAYEQRIREVEAQLSEQVKKSQGVLGGETQQGGAGDGDSVVTAERGGEEEVTSPGKGNVRAGVEELQEGLRPMGLDQTMADVTLGETRMLESGMGSAVRDMEEGSVSALQEVGGGRRLTPGGLGEGGGQITEPKVWFYGLCLFHSWDT
jgi:autophagy-related protein 11